MGAEFFFLAGFGIGGVPGVLFYFQALLGGREGRLFSAGVVLACLFARGGSWASGSCSLPLFERF